MTRADTLVMDAAAAGVRVAALCAKGHVVERYEPQALSTEALVGCVSDVLQATQTPYAELARIVFCHGPGSALGARLSELVAYTLQAARAAQHPSRPPLQVGSFNALAYAQLYLARLGPVQYPCHTLAPAGSLGWYVCTRQTAQAPLTLGTHALEGLAEVLAQGSAWVLPLRKYHPALPAQVQVCTYTFTLLADELRQPKAWDTLPVLIPAGTFDTWPGAAGRAASSPQAPDSHPVA
jgi:alpha-beta hydrolase superfamily lysophospholipase